MLIRSPYHMLSLLTFVYCISVNSSISFSDAGNYRTFHIHTWLNRFMPMPSALFRTNIFSLVLFALLCESGIYTGQSYLINSMIVLDYYTYYTLLLGRWSLRSPASTIINLLLPAKKQEEWVFHAS
jgi:hypothetical protein